MHLSEDNIHLFYKLHPALLFYANKKLDVLKDNIQTPDEFRQLDLEKIMKVREKFQRKIIEKYPID